DVGLYPEVQGSLTGGRVEEVDDRGFGEPEEAEPAGAQDLAVREPLEPRQVGGEDGGGGAGSRAAGALLPGSAEDAEVLQGGEEVAPLTGHGLVGPRGPPPLSDLPDGVLHLRGIDERAGARDLRAHQLKGHLPKEPVGPGEHEE